MTKPRPEFTSYKLQPKDAPIIRMLERLGFPNHRIAALFDCNQGRISEVLTGKRLPVGTDMTIAFDEMGYVRTLMYRNTKGSTWTRLIWQSDPVPVKTAGSGYPRRKAKKP